MVRNVKVSPSSFFVVALSTRRFSPREDGNLSASFYVRVVNLTSKVSYQKSSPFMRSRLFKV